MGLSQYRLDETVRAIDDYAKAIEPLEPLKTVVVAKAACYLIDVVLGEGAERPDRDDLQDWAERCRKVKTRERRNDIYSQSVLAIQIAMDEWSAAHPHAQPPWHSNTNYALARATSTIIHDWRRDGGLKGHGGGVNPDDFVAYIDRRFSIWTIYRVYQARERAEIAVDNCRAAKGKITEYCSTVINIAANVPVVSEQVEQLQEILKVVSKRTEFAEAAAKDCESLIRANECESKAQEASRYATECADEVSKAILVLSEALDLQAEEKAKASSTDAEDETHDKDHTDTDDAHTDTEDDGDGREQYNTEEEYLEAAFNNRIKTYSALELARLLHEKLGVNPSAGTHIFTTLCDGDSVLGVKYDRLR